MTVIVIHSMLSMCEYIKGRENMKKTSAFLLIYCLAMCTLVGCGMNTKEAEEKEMVATICATDDETNVLDEEMITEAVIEEEIIEEDLSGIVPLSKRISKGKMVAFGGIGDLHNGYVYKIFFFERGKVTVASNLEPIGEYDGFMLPSMEELANKSEEELWELCDEFKKNSKEFVQALIENNESVFYRVIDPNDSAYDSSIAEFVKSQPDSGEIYNIVLPIIDAPFVVSIETDETNSIVTLEQILIAAQRESKTYGGTKLIDGEIDGDFSLTNMAEGGEVEIGDKRYSVYPTFECNLAYICVEAETGFYFDTLDTPNTYINDRETAYEDASNFLVK